MTVAPQNLDCSAEDATRICGIGIRAFGGIDRLESVELVVPTVPPGMVLLQVEAAGVGPWDVKVREGLFGKRDFPHILGLEAAGRVVRVGAGVTHVQAGDAAYTFTYGGGCYADFVLTPASGTAHKPTEASFVEAAAVPVAASTAYQAIVEHLDVGEGDTVLINGASGGVGSFAVQIARLRGASVIATAANSNRDFVLGLGAELVVDYRMPDWPSVVRAAAPGGVKAALDCVGNSGLDLTLAAVSPTGRAAYIVPRTGSATPLEAALASFVRGEPDVVRLAALAELIDQGKLCVQVAAVLPLGEAKRAHQALADGGRRGKITLAVGGSATWC